MSNFVFSRRALQRSIDRLATLLPREQLSAIVDRLNRPNDARLPAMWELVMLDALAGVGELRHEIALPNGRRPDVELAVSLADGSPLLIVGDVATISDAGLDEQNPVNVLSTELTRLAAKAGLNPNRFGYNVQGGREGPYGDARMKLLLPQKEQLITLMRKTVSPWLNRVKAAQQQPDSLNYNEPDAHFSLTYDPNQRYARGGFLSYGVAASREKNPLYKALKSKVSQLKQASPTALRLIIACDGGCALLRQSTMMRSPGTFTAKEVAENFLRKNSSIDAVLLVAVEEQRALLASMATYHMKYELVVAPVQSQSARMTPSTLAALDTILRATVQRIPQPMRSVGNASTLCRQGGCGPDMIGGYQVSDGYVSLSSRALQRLLAGEMTISDFLTTHGWNDVPGPTNPFARALQSGRMITQITVVSAGDKDDDWLTINFGKPDPAVTPFCVSSIGE